MKREMKVIEAASFGKAKDVLKLVKRDRELLRGKDELLVKVLSCGLTPGDVRMLDGSADLFRVPVDGFPYIPAGDICGIVEDCEKDSNFNVGDHIVATWDMMGVGGLAEYAVIKTVQACLLPRNATPVEGAALINSAVYALNGIELAKIKQGDRILVLGGGGGLGTFIIQMARAAGASFVAATSTDEELMKRLKVDRFINYKNESWWEIEEFQTPEGLFDKVFDCAEGVKAWKKCNVLKSGIYGGCWYAYVHNDWDMKVHAYSDMLSVLVRPMLRSVTALICQFYSPRYHMMLGGNESDTRKRTCEMFSEGKFEVILHNDAPLPFTEAGIIEAFELIEMRKGHGNVVVSVCKS